MPFKILGIVLLIISSNCLINKQLPQIKVNTIFRPDETLSIAGNTKLAFQFPYINFEINGMMLNPKDDLNVKSGTSYNYDSFKPAESCIYYPSYLTSNITKRLRTQILIAGSHVSAKQHKIIINDGSSTVRVYSFDRQNIIEIYSSDIVGGNDPESLHNFNYLRFIEVGSNIYFINQKKFGKVPNSAQEKVQFYDGQYFKKDAQAQKNMKTPASFFKQALKIYGQAITDDTFWLVNKQRLAVYKINGTDLQTLSKIEAKEDQVFVDGIYEKERDRVYILQQNFLDIYTAGVRKTIQLEGSQCIQMNKKGSVLHIICQVNRIGFVAEYLVEDQDSSSPALILNRYITDIDDVFKIFYLGNKQVLSSQAQLFITSFGIPRQTLLDIGHKPVINTFLLKQFDQIMPIQQYSSEYEDFTIVVGFDEINIRKWNRNTPRAICEFNQQVMGSSIKLMAVFNTSSCEGSQASIKEVCTIWQPYEINLTGVQYDKKVTIFIVIIAVLSVITVSLFCLGVGFQKIQSLRVSMHELSRRIKRLKDKQKGSKPI